MSFFKLNISYLMRVKKLTQKRFAEEIGVNASRVGTWVKRGSIPTDIDTFIKIADYFGVTIDALFRINMEKEGVPTQNTQTGVPDTLQEEVAEYKTVIKELKQDKKVLQKAINALTDSKKDGSKLSSYRKSPKV